MATFSFFGKKNNRQDKTPADQNLSKNTKTTTRPITIPGQTDSDALMAQKHIARLTERKIDAIEFEMARDIGRVKQPKTNTPPAEPKIQAKNKANSEKNAGDTLSVFQNTRPVNTATSDFLLDHIANNTSLSRIMLAQSESVPLLEEAAILFANGQVAMAEQMLQSAIAQENIEHSSRTAWYMLFDLYQISGNTKAYDQLSIDYAKKFETSPPAWINLNQKNQEPSSASISEIVPSLIFPALLDASIIKLLEKLQQHSKQSRTLRLDFSFVKKVDPVGCGLLLRKLKSLKKSGHELKLLGAIEFSDKIRSILKVGRRDETEAPWLLLMEILQLLNLESAFEDACIDYSVTFEVSPPSFEVPQHCLLASTTSVLNAENQSDRFIMPTVIEGGTELLIDQIEEHAKLYETVLLDCSQLERVDFSASAHLMTGLVTIAGKRNTVIQFHEVNYLITNLFNAMGLKNIGVIYPRKH